MSTPLRDGVIYAGVSVNSSMFHNFNYMVLLRILKCGKSVLCSGALISHREGDPFVITAKHCVDGPHDIVEIYACTRQGHWNGIPLELYTNETNKNAVVYLEDMTESPTANDLVVTRRDLTLIPLKNKSLPNCASTVSTWTGSTLPNPRSRTSTPVTIVGYGWDPIDGMRITTQLKYLEDQTFQFFQMFDPKETEWSPRDRTIAYSFENEYHMDAEETGIRVGDSGGPALYDDQIIGVASYQRGNELLNPRYTGHVDITNEATIAWFDNVNAITNHTPVLRLTACPLSSSSSSTSSAAVPRVSTALFCTLFFLTSAMMVFTS